MDFATMKITQYFEITEINKQEQRDLTAFMRAL
jgi:hypothetical protein